MYIIYLAESFVHGTCKPPSKLCPLTLDRHIRTFSNSSFSLHWFYHYDPSLEANPLIQIVLSFSPTHIWYSFPFIPHTKKAKIKEKRKDLGRRNIKCDTKFSQRLFSSIATVNVHLVHLGWIVTRDLHSIQYLSSSFFLF